MATAASTSRARTTGARRATRAARPRPRRRGGIRWDRVGRTALLIVLGAVLLLYIPPISSWFAQRGTAEAQRLELHQLQVEHSELETRVRELRGPDALEREARKLGMVRAGERAFVVEDLP